MNPDTIMKFENLTYLIGLQEEVLSEKGTAEEGARDT
jgi:hypothetical protein